MYYQRIIYQSRNMFSNVLRRTLINGSRFIMQKLPLPRVTTFQQSRAHSHTTTSHPHPSQSHSHHGQKSHSSKKPKWSFSKILGTGLLISSTVGFGVAFLNDPFLLQRVERGSTFWAHMFPIYLRYKYEKWQLKGKSDEEKESRWNLIHEEYAPKVLDLLLQLRGIYIKIGQVLASRDDIAPEIYRETFKSLFDNVPGLPGPKAIEIVENALGKKIEEVFLEFDDEPLGAASIGQVHKAVLKDGRKVVVKIQYPEAHSTFKLDVSTMRLFGSLAQPEQIPIFNEMERQILAEFDFGREAWALSTVHKNIKSHFPHVIVPRPIPGLHNDKIIVMEYIPGVKLIDVIVHDYKRQAKKLGVSFEDLKKKGGLDGFSSTQKAEMYTRYAFFTGLEWTWRLFATSYNYTAGWILPNLEYGYIRPNYKKLFDTLLEVHGREILIDGVFNGDPHPGNVLVTPDGRLGLIDYGQVKSLTKAQRRELANIFLSLSKGPSNKEETIALVQKAGFETTKGSDFVLYKTTVIGFDRDDLEVTEGMGLQVYMEYLRELDETKKIPEDYVLAVRTCILLRGIGSLLGLSPISMAQRWKHIAKEALQLYPEDANEDSAISLYQRGI